MIYRTAARAFVFAFAATLVLTGCEQASAPVDEPATPQPLPENVRSWVLLEGEEGVAIALLGEGERQVLHLACLAGPPRMQVIASEFTVIGSEERLTMGVADEAFGFVADTMREGPGVQAEAAIDPSMLEHMERTEDIGAVYGAQQVGPYPAPPPDVIAAFVEGCRGLAGAPSAT
jgi:hypothetical protein